MKEVIINSENMKLGALLKMLDLVSSGGEAKHLIQQGEVAVNGEVAYERGKKIKDGDQVALFGQEPVSVRVKAAQE